MTLAPTGSYSQVEALVPALARIAWHAWWDYLDGEGAPREPVLAEYWNCSTDAFGLDQLAWPDTSGWVDFSVGTTGPGAQSGMETGDYSSLTPTAVEGGVTYAMTVVDQWLGYPVSLPEISDATLGSSYLQLGYTGERPVPAFGAGNGPSLYYDENYFGWTPDAEAAYVSGDTELFKLIEDSDGVATWQVRTVDARGDSASGQDFLTVVNTLAAYRGIIYVLPRTTQVAADHSTGSDPAALLATTSVTSFSFWREYIPSVTPPPPTAAHGPPAYLYAITWQGYGGGDKTPRVPIYRNGQSTQAKWY